MVRLSGFHLFFTLRPPHTTPPPPTPLGQREKKEKKDALCVCMCVCMTSWPLKKEAHTHLYYYLLLTTTCYYLLHFLLPHSFPLSLMFHTNIQTNTLPSA